MVIKKKELECSAWKADVLPLNYTRLFYFGCLADCPTAATSKDMLLS